MNKEILKAYAELKIQEAEISNRIKELQPTILSILEKTGKEETPLGNISLVSRTTWKYSDSVTKLAEKLKITQTEEQEKGIATASVSSSVMFKAIKI